MEPVFWDLGALLDFAVKVSSGPLPQRIHTRIGHKIIETRNPEMSPGTGGGNTVIDHTEQRLCALSCHSKGYARVVDHIG